MNGYGYRSESLRRSGMPTNNPRLQKRYRTTLKPLPRAERVTPFQPIGAKVAVTFAVLMLIVLATAFGALLKLGGADAWMFAGSEGDKTTRVGQLAETGPASTPVSDWKRGQMPYLYQTDPAWSSTPYANATIKTHGCGPTCLSMIQAYFVGRGAKDPAALCQFSEANGFVDSGATSWLFMTEGAARLGLTGRELPASEEVIRAQLRMGHPVVCCVGPGNFTTEGHFIVLCDEQADGTIEVRDPNSEERSHQLWSLERILSQCRNLWAFSG